MISKHLIQAILILDTLNIDNSKLWQLFANRALFLLHKYTARDLAMLMRLYNKDFVDENGEVLPMVRKLPDAKFFERITAILPMHVPMLKDYEVVDVVEILTKKNLGSERFWNNHLLLRVERNVLKFSCADYVRVIRALADKQYY